MKDKIKKDSMDLFLQKQPYNITVAKRLLCIHQERILMRAMEAMQPYMSTEVDYTKRMPDLRLTLQVSDLVRGNNVKPLRKALDGLLTKIVRLMHYLPDKATYLEVGTTIIQAYEYEHGSSFVNIKIGGELVPQLVDLTRRGYTKYSIQVAFNTSSPNTFKLYQYIAHFRDKKQIQCNVETLRKWLQIENKYALPTDIKRKILVPAMEELKKKADVWFSIAERVTQGRRMIGWKFNVHTRKVDKSSTNPPPKKLPQEPPAGRLENDLINKFKLSSKQAKNVIKNIPAKELHKELYQINLRILNRELKNVGGYTAKILGDKFNVKL